MNLQAKINQSGDRSRGQSLYRLEDASPSIDPSAWIAPTAAVIGDVRIGAESGIWFHCVPFHPGYSCVFRSEPAKLRRTLTDEERKGFASNAMHYARNAVRFSGALAAI